MPRKSKPSSSSYKYGSFLWDFLDTDKFMDMVDAEYPSLVYSCVIPAKNQNFTARFLYYNKFSKTTSEFSFLVNMYLPTPSSLMHSNSAIHSNPSTASLMWDRQDILGNHFPRVSESIYNSTISACANSAALIYRMPRILNYNSTIIKCAGIAALITFIQIFSKNWLSLSSSLELTVLSFSAYYLLSSLSTIAKNKLDRTSEQLEQILDATKNDLKTGEIKAADLKFSHLGLLYSILLHPKFPNKRELQWRFFYLNAKLAKRCSQYSRAAYSYKLALALSISNKEKFKILRLLIDLLHYKNIMIKDKYPDGYKTEFDEEIKEYLQQILTLSDEYKEVADKTETLLRQCLSNLSRKEGGKFFFSKEEYKTACKIFDSIPWDGFLENIPNLAIPYYQTKILLTITNEGYQEYEYLYRSERWSIFCTDIYKIQRHAKQFYPTLAIKNMWNVLEFQKIYPYAPYLQYKLGDASVLLEILEEEKKEDAKRPVIISLDEGLTLEKYSP